MRIVSTLTCALACLAGFTAIAPATRLDAASGGSHCPSHFAMGQAPQIQHAPLAEKTIELCSASFVVLHSGRSLGPLYAAEHLTKSRLSAARTLPRRDSFRADDRLPAGGRAELADYAHSGFDRGHLAPNFDMPDAQSQAESFVLSNMVPQDPHSNRYLWSDIESAARAMAIRDGEAYVVTGPAFYGPGRRVGRVAVPDYLWKAIYLPKSQRAAAWFAPNKAGRDYQIISIAELTRATGIDPFPALPAALKRDAATLLHPRPRHSGQQG